MDVFIQFESLLVAANSSETAGYHERPFCLARSGFKRCVLVSNVGICNCECKLFCRLTAKMLLSRNIGWRFQELGSPQNNCPAIPAP